MVFLRCCKSECDYDISKNLSTLQHQKPIGDEMLSLDIQSKNTVKHVGVPLQEFFSEVHASLHESFGREISSINSVDQTLYFFISNIFLPGTLSCLTADNNLIYPTLLLFINKYMKGYRNEIGMKNSLLISPVSPEEMVFRIIAYNLRTGKDRLRDGIAIGQDWPKLVRIAGIIHDGNIFSLSEEPECLRNSISSEDNRFSNSKRLRDVFDSPMSKNVPFGLIIIHSDPESQKDGLKNISEFTRRLEELRKIATDFQLAVIVTHNIQDQMISSNPSDFEKRFDYQMELQPEMNRYALSVSHRENGLVGTIPLVMFPEIGVMED